jgi:hypothetical protein
MTTTMKSIAAALLAACLPCAAVAAPFDISDSYSPSPDLVPGHYACVSGLDFHDFTWVFDVAEDGTYTVEGLEGVGSMTATGDGEVLVDGGPFASDETATVAAMSTIRVSDGTPAIIVRYDFGHLVTDDYCARFR